MEIGKAFNRDHSSVIHSLDVIHQKYQSDSHVRHQIDFLAEQIKKPCP